MLGNIIKNMKGQFAMAVGSVVALLVTISIGAMVLYSVTGALETETESDSYADNAINAVEEKGGTVFNLLSILAIVVVAATIIGAVIGAVGSYGGETPAPFPGSTVRLMSGLI